MSTLTKKTALLDHSWTEVDGEDLPAMEFFELADEDGERRYLGATVGMPTPEWIDMGKPDKVTVTIVPGDALNETEA